MPFNYRKAMKDSLSKEKSSAPAPTPKQDPAKGGKSPMSTKMDMKDSTGMMQNIMQDYNEGRVELRVGDKTYTKPEEIANYVLNNPTIMNIIENSDKDKEMDAQQEQQEEAAEGENEEE